MSKSTISIFILVALIFTFLAVRARHELRWSALANADAENLIATRHFVKDGFREHYFLNYFSPGYIGKTQMNVSKLGYDPHYPSFGEILNTLIIRVTGENIYILKLVGITFSCLALLLLYGVLTFFFNNQVSALGTAFIALSVSFLDHADGLNPYVYSEAFRFGAMFLFLCAMKYKSKALLIGTWIVTFLETMNNNDYVMFLQLFFFLYFYFNKSIPWGKVAFLASAPILGLGIRVMQVVTALGGKEAILELTTRSILSGEKTAPLGWDFFSFCGYFARTMEGHMVNSHFGFGFALVLLIVALSLRSKRKELVIFIIPSLSWWLMFPNHTASFFWMPKHLWPVIALLFGIVLSACMNTFKQDKLFVVLVIIAVLWSHGLFTGKYLKEYPNLISPQTRTQLGELRHFNAQEVEGLVDTFRGVREATKYGDIVFIPFKENALFASYANRRLDYFTSEEDLKSQVEDLKEYKAKFDLKIYRLNGRSLHEI